MVRMFVTASFQSKENKEEIEYLCALVKKSGFDDFCFIRDVEHYKRVFTNVEDLMKRALLEISKSDYLLIDMTDKPTGRAVEAGIAYALGKKIVVIMKKGTTIKDATRGIATAIIEYENIDEITSRLTALLDTSM